MGERGFRLGSILGFEIRLDPSWFVIFFLLLWSLSAGVFPSAVPGAGPVVHVAMGVVATLLFFASLVAHEVSHSLVARSRGIPMAGITLFIFGGMAHATLEPDDPGDELVIAGVGPLVSLLLGGMFLGMAQLGRGWGWSPAVNEVSAYLGFINLALAAFNLLPGFPLDGGRIFRAAIWGKTGDLARATRWASTGGRLIGFSLIGLGALEFLLGGLLGGLWLVLIGLFLKGAADATLRRFLVESVLEGIPVRQGMSSAPPTIGEDTTLAEWIRSSLMETRHSSFPVSDNGHLTGVVTLDDIEGAGRDARERKAVRDVMTPLDESLVTSADADMKEVLAKVRASKIHQVVVVDHGEAVGVVTPADLEACVRRIRLKGD